MNIGLLVALLGLTAALSWGVSDFFAARSAKSVGPVLASVLVNVLGSLLFAITYVIVLRPQVSQSLRGDLYAAASGVFLGTGAASFFIGLEAGPVSIVSPLTSTYPLVTTGLALALFHAHLSALEVAGIVLTVLGILVASGLLTLKRSERKLGRGPAFALLAAFTWGIGYVFLAQAMRYLNWEFASLVEFTSVSVMLVTLVPFIKGKEIVSARTIAKGLTSRFVIGAAVIQLLGVIALNLGIAKSTASSGAVVTAISACYPILTIFLALKKFDERVRLLPLAGAMVGVVGVVVLSLG